MNQFRKVTFTDEGSVMSTCKMTECDPDYCAISVSSAIKVNILDNVLLKGRREHQESSFSNRNPIKESCAIEIPHNKPMRGLTAYNIFFKYERDKLISGNTKPVIEQSERTNLLPTRHNTSRKDSLVHRL